MHQRLKSRNRTRKPARARFAAGLFDELIVDNFAGGGGASMGIEQGFGRAVDVAINHDPIAVEMHKANHPHTFHACENVWKVRPRDVTGGRPVGLAWFSPDCTHFSDARGSKPVKQNIRCLASVVIRWARLVGPRVIILENVKAFLTWGPVIPKLRDGKPVLGRDGKPELVPDPARKGEIFAKFVRKLRDLGYAVEWRVLDAADYGAPTHRRRLFLIGRRDGRPVAWPEKTHGPGRARPFRTAAECIDWSLPCPSIFLTAEQGRALGVNRPLKDKTMRRIAMGLKRFVIDNPRPYIVRCNHGGSHFRGQSVDSPLATVTAHHGFGVVNPFVAGVGGRMGQSPATPSAAPLGTITAKNDRALVAPFLTAQYGEAPHQQTRGQCADEPLRTITPRTGGGFSLISPHLTKFFGGVVGQEATGPAPTITAIDHTGVVAAHLVQYNQEKGAETRGKPITDPLNVITTENRFGLVATFLSQHNGERPDGSANPGGPADSPLPTITSRATQTMVAVAALSQFNGQSVGQVVDRPGPTQCSERKTAVVAANLVRTGQYGGNGAYSNGVEQPLTTIVSKQEHCLVTGAANLVHMNHGDKQWSDIEDPLRTILAGANHHGLVLSFLQKYYGTGGGQRPDEPLGTVTPKDRFGLVAVEGRDYAIVDIGLRMLSPRELFRCQGFPEHYEIAPVVTVETRLKSGKVKTRRGPLPKYLQTRMVGNSVSPHVAKAVVRANFPEECAHVAHDEDALVSVVPIATARPRSRPAKRATKPA